MRARQCRPWIGSHGRAAVVISAVWLIAGAGLHAQTVYKWVDDNGVVHFSDVPPAGGQKYEERGGRAQEPEAKPAARTDQPEISSGEPPAAAAPAVEATKGPARVILTANQSFPRSADARHVIGVVKNVGGRAAAQVRVTVHVASSQGQDCGREEVDVTPPTLEAGESGNFDATITNPCFADGGSVDAEPQWD
ncbi:MAG: DUF4124 domain-containing protein [Deltaproteobacteria bacterium]|nr:DUF4124 domain-containing protein [Deltaproteobacteria bacterium]